MAVDDARHDIVHRPGAGVAIDVQSGLAHVIGVAPISVSPRDEYTVSCIT